MKINIQKLSDMAKSNRKISFNIQKNKKTFAAMCLGIIVITGGTIAYSGAKSEIVTNSDNIKAVSVTTLSEEGYTKTKKYSGYVTAKDNKNLSFLVGGRISEISVEEGEEVKSGQAIAKIDTSSIQLDIDNTTQNINLVKISIDKLNTSIESANVSLEESKNSYDTKISQMEDSFKNEEENFERYKSLYDAGAITLVEFEGKQLSYNTSKSALESARATRDNQVTIQEKQIETLKNDLDTANIKLKQSQIGLEQSQKNLENAVIVSPCDGYVVSIPMKQGEVTNAGTPVIVIKGGSKIINIGVDSGDYKNYSVGMEVIIDSDREKSGGVITAVSAYPDESTKTYNLEITPENQNLVLGNLVNIEIPLSHSQGYFIPISSVINREGTDYIYIIKDSNNDEWYNVERKEVTLGEVDGENVKIEDFNETAQVITDGVKYIKETDKVSINE